MKLSRDAWFVVILFSVFSVVTYVSLRRAPQQSEGPESSPHYTSYSSQRSGLKAFYIILRRLEYRPERLVEIPGADLAGNRVLIMEKPIGRYADLRSGAVNRWIRNGGRAIVFLGSGSFVPGLGAEAWHHALNSGSIRVRVEPAFGDGVRRLDLRSKARLEVDPGWRTVARDSAGIIAAEKEVGKGSVIVVSDPWMASNSQIGKSDNAVFLVNLISARAGRGDAVAFDEYSQGYSAPKTVLAVLPYPWKLALAQIVLAALLAVYSAGRRFGSVNAASEDRARRPAHEYVRAMGRLYRKADAGRAAFEIIYDALWADLCVRLGVPADSDAAAVAEDLPSSESENLIHLSKRRRDGEPISQTELVHLAGMALSIRKETGIDR